MTLYWFIIHYSLYIIGITTFNVRCRMFNVADDKNNKIFQHSFPPMAHPSKIDKESIFRKCLLPTIFDPRKSRVKGAPLCSQSNQEGEFAQSSATISLTKFNPATFARINIQKRATNIDNGSIWRRKRPRKHPNYGNC